MGKSGIESGFWNSMHSGAFIQNRAFMMGFDRSIERLDQMERDQKKLQKKEGNEAEKEHRNRV
jgi:hypothetical protein